MAVQCCTILIFVVQGIFNALVFNEYHHGLYTILP